MNPDGGGFLQSVDETAFSEFELYVDSFMW